MEQNKGPFGRLRGNIEARMTAYREEYGERHAALEAERAELWKEAAERERALQAAQAEEQAAPEVYGPVFVMHTEEASRVLERAARNGARLAEVSAGSPAENGAGVRGSWLLFEPASEGKR